MNPNSSAQQQLQTYVRSLFSQHIDEQTIRANLLNAGWDSNVIEATISRERPSPHRVRNGLLWIFSPIIVLVGTGIVGGILGALHVQSASVNIIVILMGLIGGLLVIIGPVVGVVILSRR